MTSATDTLPERESIEVDVVIVGAGPAGLASAIKLKQLNAELNVVVLEKGSEVGAHIVSGAVMDPIGMDALLPNWRQEPDHPFKTPVQADHFLWLSKNSALRLPNSLMPKLMNNHGNYIVSLANVCRWLASKAEELGVDIYPGFAATELLFNEQGAVCGVATGDMGLDRSGTPSSQFERGMALFAKYVLLGEGARGSLSKQVIKHYDLSANADHAKFGLGIKELWEVAPEKHQAGLVQHSFGWPLDGSTGGGSFLYHLEDNLVAVGFVVHLNYKNPYLSPYEEFQRFKTHPKIKETFTGAKRISYGARAISEGGWQSVPKLSFPGGVLLGCAAGLVNVPRIKGSHNAILSGMLCAEHVAKAIALENYHGDLTALEQAWRQSAIGQDLKKVRNVKPLWSKLGTLAGVALGGLDMWTNELFGGSLFGTLKHGKSDAQSLEPASRHQVIDYPKPDGVLTFDRLSSVFMSNTNHAEEQPCHLKVMDMSLQKSSELGLYAGPSTRFCPAGVYEWVERESGTEYVVNAQNCIHCKTCDIKDPNQNITWVPPQGAEGPVYPNM
ncbi:electron transfer flavoprotein-ubiquinone oxidoreductase [Marinomonas ostreistagni]|uniref:electron transfer flavoprotein-ubiquinone oxidoreductase n=1 Tax=Marinomonas ostreistagni TaxID=359209 RepID=UPI002D7E4CCE|nr:electron transfer flavoprotein-ubiquinone oxidoreductase [Marinomonas ostreistagni]